MRRIVILISLVAVWVMPSLGQAQNTQEAFTPSGRFSWEIPSEWIFREYPDE